MIRLAKDETKAMVAVHGWSGILLGLLLYAVVLTGTVAVFAQEIGAWSAGHVATRSAFQQPIDNAIRALAARTPSVYHEDVNLWETGDRGLGVFFHRHETGADGLPTEAGYFYRLDNRGQVLSAAKGNVDTLFGPRNDDALATFLVETHVRLHLPNPWGLLLTGLLGLALLVAAISGLLIHRHLFKDIFTLRRRAGAVLVKRDQHSVAGTWSLPFAFVLALTGSFFSFYGTVGVPVVAMAVFGGNVEALNEAVYGNPGKPDPRPAAIGSLDRIITDAIRRTGQVPTFIAFEKFGRTDAAVTTYHNPKTGDLDPVTLLYNGATAQFMRVKAQVGAQPSAGGTLVGIMGPLHFGNFAGMVSKAVWFGLGFAMCYVTYTGMRLWVVRRRTDARSLAWLERTLSVVGWGLPLCLVASAAGFLIAMPLGMAVRWTTSAFLLAAAAAILCGAFASTNEVLTRLLKAATGAIMIALPALRLLVASGPGWHDAVSTGQPIIAAIDLACLLGGIWLVRDCWTSRPVPVPQRAARVVIAQAR